MRIVCLEPYAALSHLRFLEGWRDGSRHEIEIHALPARRWKWRMRTASLHWSSPPGAPPDLYVVSDYLNAAEWRALLPPEHAAVPLVVLFHENQLTYPLQEGERRDVHHALTHLHAILVASAAWFNSTHHLESFHAALAELLRRVPDVDVHGAAEHARARSEVVPLGVDLPAGEPRPPVEVPRVLWSQRWEYDKGPRELVRTLAELAARGERFRAVLAGQRFRAVPEELRRLVRAGTVEVVDFLEERADYEALLAGCDVVLSTARHEFFGLGVLEAVRSGCLPVLPADLAYPELYGDSPAARLYPREAGPTAALADALAVVRGGAEFEGRRALVRSTDRFHWDACAPELDRRAERACAAAHPC